MIHFTTWMWGSKFEHADVAKLRRGIARGMGSTTHTFTCFTDQLRGKQGYTVDGVQYFGIQDPELTRIPGCFARLRMFDPAWQVQHKFSNAGDVLINVDIDTVVTGDLNPVVDRTEPFVIMQGANTANPCPYNGALILLQPGYASFVWDTFKTDAPMPFFEYPDDQGWLHYTLPGAPGWVVGPEHGVYVFRKRGWPQGSDALPRGAKLVTFVRKHPAELGHLDWVRENWR